MKPNIQHYFLVLLECFIQFWLLLRSCKLIYSPKYCFFLVFFQILTALDQDDQAGKQKLAYKLEQVITLMSIDS